MFLTWKNKINCQGKIAICQGIVREMSGNFEPTQMWQPCYYVCKILYIKYQYYLTTIFVVVVLFIVSQSLLNVFLTSCPARVTSFTCIFWPASVKNKNVVFVDFILAQWITYSILLCSYNVMSNVNVISLLIIRKWSKIFYVSPQICLKDFWHAYFISKYNLFSPEL